MQRFQIHAGILTVFLVTWGILVTSIPTISSGMRISQDFSGIPVNIKSWFSDGNLPVDKKSLEVLSTSAILNRDYFDPDGHRVNLSIVYGRQLGDLHQPEFCMLGQDFRVDKSKFVTIRPVKGKPFTAAAVVMTNQLQDIVMVYWFYIGKKIVPRMGSQKLRALTLAMIGGELPASVMVKFTAPVLVDEETAMQKAIELCEILTPSIIEMANKPLSYESKDKILNE